MELLNDSSATKCAHCGARIPFDAPEGFCLLCLVREGAASRRRTPAFARPMPPCFGDYEIIAELGRGGMGRVYRARQISLDRVVALKVIGAGEMSASNVVSRFRNEAEAAASLDHPNIVSIYEVGEHEGWNFFSMRLVEGQTLGQALIEGQFSFERTARLLITVARAIQHAHERGVLHRDLKPGNILLDRAGAPHVTDFGLAKFTQRSRDLTLSNTALGTPAYMSPEQASGRVKEITTAVDIYGLGAVMFELLTGVPPFSGDTPVAIARNVIDQEPAAPSSVNPSVPIDLAVICLKCLEKDPASRYPTAAALAADLERWIRHEPIEARRISFSARALRWARRQPTMAAMILATSAAVAALLVTLVLADLRVRAAHQATQRVAEENRQRLVKLDVLTGNRLGADGDRFGALLWFAEAWRLDQGVPGRDQIHRRRLAATLRETPSLVQQWTHQGFVGSAEFSPDGARIVTASLDKTARVWDVVTGEPVGPPLIHQGSVWVALFTPDGRRVVTSSDDGKVRYWDLPTGRLTGEPLPTLTSEIDSGNFSPDGRWFAAPSRGLVRLFTAGGGEPTRLAFPTSANFDKVQFSPDGRWLAAFGDSIGLCFWDLSTGRRAFESLSFNDQVRMLRFNPNHRSVAITLGARTVDLRNLDTGVGLPPVEPGGDLFDCRFSPDGRLLATASWNGTVRIFDAATSSPLAFTIQHQAGVRSSVFSPDGRMLATASWDATARLWNVADGRPLSPALHHGGYVTSVRFSPSAPRVVTASQDQTVRVWDVDTNGPARLLVRHRGAVRQAEFSPDGQRFLTCGEDKLACVWDASSGRRLLSFAHPQAVLAADFSPKGDYVATGCADGSVHRWDTRVGTEVRFSPGHTGWVRCVSFSPDGRKLLTASDDGVGRIWDVETGAPTIGQLVHRGAIIRAFFSRNGASVVTASQDGTAQVWSALTGERVGPPLVHSSEVHSVAFSPDGARIATATCDDTQLPQAAQVWDAVTGRKIGQPLPHRDGIVHIEFSPDGRRVVTASKDKTAIVWDAWRGKPLAPPLRHLSYVSGASFSPDGNLVLTISSDGTARVWETQTGEPITPPLAHENMLSAGHWRPDGQEIITSSYDGSACLWDIAPTQETLENLQLQAELLSASRLDPQIGPVSLTAQEMAARWQSFRDSRKHLPTEANEGR